MDKTEIRRFDAEELTNIVMSYGEPKFKAKQLYKWIWNKGILDFDQMTNLSIKLRESLKSSYKFDTFSQSHIQKSADGTIKTGWKLHDNSIIESVIIPLEDEERYTLCISSQAGCSLNCNFCATARLKLKRNLTYYEIIEQFIRGNEICEKEYGHTLTNIVYMGMGEPLLNFENIIKSVRILNDPECFGYSTRRITISTAGIVKAIDKMTEENVKVNLALSLHAADNEKRTEIMPINKTNSIEDLMEALLKYYDKCKTRISFEYILFKNFNDFQEDAKRLSKLTRKFPVRVNIIEYNHVDGVELEGASEERIERFVGILTDNGVTTTVRRSRGKDIDAACGQLANKLK